jgi:hypothetical protein
MHGMWAGHIQLAGFACYIFEIAKGFTCLDIVPLVFADKGFERIDVLGLQRNDSYYVHEDQPKCMCEISTIFRAVCVACSLPLPQQQSQRMSFVPMSAALGQTLAF